MTPAQGEEKMKTEWVAPNAGASIGELRAEFADTPLPPRIAAALLCEPQDVRTRLGLFEGRRGDNDVPRLIALFTTFYGHDNANAR